MNNVFRSNHFPEGTIFTCPRCGKRFKSGNPNVQCLVLHPEGTCCHYTDKEISFEKGETLMLVKVTQEHIDKGRQNFKNNKELVPFGEICPVALALKDVFKVEYTFAARTKLLIGKFPENLIINIVDVPKKVIDFINKFDGFEEGIAEPFEFELSLEGVKL